MAEYPIRFDLPNLFGGGIKIDLWRCRWEEEGITGRWMRDVREAFEEETERLREMWWCDVMWQLLSQATVAVLTGMEESVGGGRVLSHSENTCPSSYGLPVLSIFYFTSSFVWERIKMKKTFVFPPSRMEWSRLSFFPSLPANRRHRRFAAGW